MDARNAITNSVETEFNEKYFGGAAEQGMHMRNQLWLGL